MLEYYTGTKINHRLTTHIDYLTRFRISRLTGFTLSQYKTAKITQLNSPPVTQCINQCANDQINCNLRVLMDQMPITCGKA